MHPLITQFKTALNEQGLSDKDLANLTKIHANVISEIMSGKRQNPTISTLAKIAAALGGEIKFTSKTKKES